MGSSSALGTLEGRRADVSTNRCKSYAELTSDQAAIVDRVCDEFEANWQNGEAPDFQTFISSQPEVIKNALLEELFQIEWNYRSEMAPDSFADVLRRYFPNGDSIVIRSQAHGFPSVALPVQEVAKCLPFDDYDDLKEVGRGGMGIVYQAKDKRLGRLVCLKTLPPDSALQPDRLLRFQREARAISLLNHPNICTMYDLKETETDPFLVLEWIEGLTLRSAVDGTKLTSQMVLSIARQIAQALAAAHAAGIVHRDIKPDNVMLRPDGIVKVLDFGLARLRQANSDIPLLPNEVTAVGMVIGTLQYMSPEQARGEPVDEKSDIFSLGALLYELTTGQRPFAGNNLPRLLGAIEFEIPDSPLQLAPDIRPDFSFLILSMLDKAPARRPSACDIVHWFERTQETHVSPLVPSTVWTEQTPRATVGRTVELEALQFSLQRASDGEGHFLCVSGEPGIGKTTLVEEFLHNFTRQDRHIVVQGRCSERLAGTEAYLPVLDALERMLASGDSMGVASILKSSAPSWFELVTSELFRGAPSGEITAPSQEKLKREFRVFLFELSRVRPVIFYLDDIHWADASTIDLLSYLAGDIATMRVVVLLTMRLTEIELRGHEFKRAKLEFEARGLCHELTLGFIDSSDIRQYLDLRYRSHTFPDKFAEWLRTRTEGNPMFVANMLQFLQDRKIVFKTNEGWSLSSTLQSVQYELPGTIRSLVEKRLSLISEHDLRLLRAAAVQGYEFDAAVLSRALGLDHVDVEERLEAIAVNHALIGKLGEKEFADGTLSNRYQFVHALYQNAIFESLQPARRVALSRSVAGSLQELYLDQIDEIASELALLWESSREWTQSAKCFNLAAQHANGLFAYRESLQLAQHGLHVLNKHPENVARAELELQLQGTIGVPLLATKGYAAPEVGTVQRRVYELSKVLGDRDLLIRSTRQLHSYYMIQGQVVKSLEQAEAFVADANRCGEKQAIIEAYNCRALSLCHMARLPECFEDFKRILELCDVETAAKQEQLIALNPRVLAISTRGWLRWFLGEVDSAIQEQLVATALCEAPRTQSAVVPSFSLIHTLFVRTLIHQHRGDVADVAELSQRVIDHSKAQGNTFYLAMGTIWQGWSLAHQGDLVDGLRQMEEGYAACLSLGSRVCEPHVLGMRAECLGRLNRVDEAISVIDAALQSSRTTGQHLYDADLLRIKGVLLCSAANQNALAAETCFRQALQLARSINFRSLELRAATSLYRLLKDTSAEPEIRVQLVNIHEWFTQGFETSDWQAAKDLLR